MTSPNLQPKLEPEVVSADFFYSESAKSCDNALKRHQMAIIAGASETVLLAFHFWSQVLDQN